MATEEILPTPVRLRSPLAILHTSDSVTLSVLRIGLGLVMFPHGAQKLLGWFGGPGFSGTMNAFTSGLHIPAPVAFLVIVGEFVASILLLTGLFTRIAALIVTAIMLGAILIVHAPNGFFMNWSGAQAGEGFEFHLLALTIAIGSFIGGGGAGSIDRVIEIAKSEDRVDPLESSA
jgi:putative oxidoreductase